MLFRVGWRRFAFSRGSLGCLLHFTSIFISSASFSSCLFWTFDASLENAELGIFTISTCLCPPASIQQGARLTTFRSCRASSFSRTTALAFCGFPQPSWEVPPFSQLRTSTPSSTSTRGAMRLPLSLPPPRPQPKWGGSRGGSSGSSCCLLKWPPPLRRQGK